MKIDKVEVNPVSSNVFRVSVTVANDKVYPTSSDMSVQLKRSVEDKLSLSTSDNITIVPSTAPAAVAAWGAGGSMGAAAVANVSRTTSSKELKFRLGGQQKTDLHLPCLHDRKLWMDGVRPVVQKWWNR
ncbi:MAG: hypothetical protein MZV63_14595 [Marinilabiliales bacterium]|nr:hypothetical protein [Marinilabiliales bacterium]